LLCFFAEGSGDELLTPDFERVLPVVEFPLLVDVYADAVRVARFVVSSAMAVPLVLTSNRTRGRRRLA
jgi:hypothetical protein